MATDTKTTQKKAPAKKTPAKRKAAPKKTTQKTEETQTQQAEAQEQQASPMSVIVLSNICSRLGRLLGGNQTDANRLIKVAQEIGTDNIYGVQILFDENHGSYTTTVFFLDAEMEAIDSVNMNNIGSVVFGTLKVGSALTQSIEALGVGIGNDWLFYDVVQDSEAFTNYNGSLQLQQDCVFAISRETIEGLINEPGFGTKEITIQDKIIRTETTYAEKDDKVFKMFLMT